MLNAEEDITSDSVPVRVSLLGAKRWNRSAVHIVTASLHHPSSHFGVLGPMPRLFVLGVLGSPPRLFSSSQTATPTFLCGSQRRPFLPCLLPQLSPTSHITHLNLLLPFTSHTTWKIESVCVCSSNEGRQEHRTRDRERGTDTRDNDCTVTTHYSTRVWLNGVTTQVFFGLLPSVPLIIQPKSGVLLR